MLFLSVSLARTAQGISVPWTEGPRDPSPLGLVEMRSCLLSLLVGPARSRAEPDAHAACRTAEHRRTLRHEGSTVWLPMGIQGTQTTPSSL